LLVQERNYGAPLYTINPVAGQSSRRQAAAAMGAEAAFVFGFSDGRYWPESGRPSKGHRAFQFIHRDPAAADRLLPERPASAPGIGAAICEAPRGGACA